MRPQPRALLSLSLALVPALGCGDRLAADCEHGEDASAAALAERPWLLAIDESDPLEGDGQPTDALVRVRLDPGHEGEREVLCPSLALPPELPADTNFTSLVVQGERLYASALLETWGDTLVEVDPCTCTASVVGSYGFTQVAGLAAADELDGLFGLAAEGDALLTIDAANANAEALVELAADWGSNALSPARTDGAVELYALDASSDRLYTFRASDGLSMGSVPLSQPLLTAGLELHPEIERLYACGVEGRETALYELTPDSGALRMIADGVFASACDNLAAPNGPIACIPDDFE